MTYIPADLRTLVIARARESCEYCLVHADYAVLVHEIDHVIAEKHGGTTEAENLAYTCQPCNRNKGSDLGSIYWPSGQLVPFFHPRRDHWTDHFALHGAFIHPLTAIGEVTARILGFNSEERRQERHGLIEEGRYPPPAAMIRIRQ